MLGRGATHNGQRPALSVNFERCLPLPPTNILVTVVAIGKFVNPILTPESRAKALEARKAAIANNPYRKDWLDSSLWDSLAQKRGIRLPQWHRAPTPRLLKRAHESLEKTPFEEVYGCKPSRLIALNPTMPMRAFIGQMLERVA